MSRNPDGTVVLKTTGKVASTPSGSGTGKTVTHAFKGAAAGAGHLVWNGAPRRSWRIVSKTER